MSVRLPGNLGHYVVNPFGLNYDKVTPVNLLKIDLDGKLVQRSRSFFRPRTVRRADEIKYQALWLAGGNAALPVSVGQRCADQTQRLFAGNGFADK
jgi:hypothetical protein